MMVTVKELVSINSPNALHMPTTGPEKEKFKIIKDIAKVFNIKRNKKQLLTFLKDDIMTKKC